MAEGCDFGYDDERLDYNIDHGDDDKQVVDTTCPFEPGAASTPYYGGEQYEMRTMQHEQSGLPDTSYEETPLLRRPGSIGDFQRDSVLRQKMKKSVDMIKAKFPRTNFEIIKIWRGSGKNSGKIVAIGSEGGEYKVLKDDESHLTKSFLDSLKNKLGPRAEEIIAQDRNTIQEQCQRLAEVEKQERQANALTTEKEKEGQEVENVRQQVERTYARIDALQEEHGSNIESEAEINRLKQLKKNYQKDLDSKKKKWPCLKNKQKTKRNRKQRLIEKGQSSAK